MIFCNNAELEKAAKYGCCRNQPFELADNGESGDFGDSIR
jgi:hypothetical protein